MSNAEMKGARGLIPPLFGNRNYLNPGRFTETEVILGSTEKHRNVHGESEAAFIGSTSRGIVKRSRETSLLTMYEELRAEYDRLRNENVRLHSKLEEFERRLATSSNQIQDEMKDSRESTGPLGEPMMKITIQDHEVVALVDEYCQVSCLSEQHYEENISTLGSCLVLPVPNT